MKRNNPEQIVCSLSQATIYEEEPETDEQEGFVAEPLDTDKEAEED